MPPMMSDLGIGRERRVERTARPRPPVIPVMKKTILAVGWLVNVDCDLSLRTEDCDDGGGDDEEDLVDIFRLIYCSS